MKIALLGDIHANLPALDAVLEHARKRSAGAIWCLGDSVGYGPYPDEVIRLLQRKYALCLRGNYDNKVLCVEEKRERWLLTKGEEKVLAFQWAWDNLSQESRKWLAGLPETLRLSLEGHRILLAHGSPDSPKEFLGEETPRDRFAEIIADTGANALLFAHTHRPFCERIDGVLLLNPGSVGRPVDGDPRASYALLSVTKKGIEAELFRVPYDVDQCVSALRAAGLPEEFGNMFLSGTDLGEAPVSPEEGEAERFRAEALRVGQKYVDMGEHMTQVAGLAVLLFDELIPLHGYGPEERRLLELAALLHDIGWCEGRLKHHKWSERLIVEDEDLSLSRRERRLVACIARYHRRGLPRASHRLFGTLSEEEQTLVRVLAGLLRVADGLDNCHLSLVEGLSCTIRDDRVDLRVVASQFPQGEDEKALRKGDLFRECFNREIAITWDLHR